MTISPFTATATAATTATFVPGPGRTGVDLTLVLPMHGSATALRYVVGRLIEALYSQCISFEMVAIADIDGVPAAELSDLPLTRYIRADRQDPDSSITTGLAMASGQWIGVLDFDDEIDPYDFIELLHQARERSVSQV
ncbi:glycosyltransferase [Actinoplanes derwentensis]|uniref:Glycosyl transferase family 2 n=1 Tax=Actinoplanes derwentensis TaxID=113562 RepID=A0A1H2ALN8_9ACTN|nr:glycosyltransferase [Actinoplanes derwentensis]GID89305.1 hypothetical protein Ade03nite_82290 [Actinoplanes derwentensis]SDT46831.1 Glycosyl transferase family 2 [Actinoplanes derwentensis]